MPMERRAGWDDIVARRDVLAAEDALAEVARRRHELALAAAALEQVDCILSAALASFFDADSYAGSGLTRAAASTLVDWLLAESRVDEVSGG